MSGKPLTNMLMGKQETHRASGPAVPRSVPQGWERGAGRAGVQRVAPGPGWPVQTLLGHAPARRLQASEASALYAAQWG